jgi:hypothetical protein
MKSRPNFKQKFCSNCGLVVVREDCPYCGSEISDAVELSRPRVKRFAGSGIRPLGFLGLILLLIGFVFPNFVTGSESFTTTTTLNETVVASTTTPLNTEQNKPSITSAPKMSAACVLSQVHGYETVASDCAGELFESGWLLVRDSKEFDQASMGQHELTNVEKSDIQNFLTAVQKTLGSNFVQRWQASSGEEFCWFDGNHEGNELDVLTDFDEYGFSACSVVFDTSDASVNQEFARENNGMYPIVEVTPIFLGVSVDRWSSSRRLNLLIRTSWSFCEGSC